MKNIYLDSVNGNDSNTGLSVPQAIRTFVRLNEIIEPKSNIYILGGSVFQDKVTLTGGKLVSSDKMSNAATIMLRYTADYHECNIMLDLFNSQKNVKPIIKASVKVPQNAISVHSGNVRTFIIEHEHGKHVPGSSTVDSDARAFIWINDKALKLVETLAEVSTTPNSYFAENTVEPVMNGMEIFVTKGVITYYFNYSGVINDMECTFKNMTIWDSAVTGIVPVNLTNLKLMRGASKDGNHLDGGICDGIEFEDYINHAALKSFSEMRNCSSKRAGTYNFHAFTASKLTVMRYFNCYAEGKIDEKIRTTGYFTHGNIVNPQKLHYQKCDGKYLAYGFSPMDFDEMTIEDSTIENAIGLISIGSEADNTLVKLKNVKFFNNKEFAGRQISGLTKVNAYIENCALHGAGVYLPNRPANYVLEYKNCTIISFSNNDLYNIGSGNNGYVGIYNLINTLFGSNAPIIKQGSGTFNNVFLNPAATRNFENSYLHNMILRIGNDFYLPSEYPGLDGNLKSQKNVDLFQMIVRPYAGTTSEKGVITSPNRSIISDIAYHYTGRYIYYTFQLNKNLQYIKQGAGGVGTWLNNVRIVDEQGRTLWMENTYGDQYSSRFDPKPIINADNTTGAAQNFLAGNILNWEKGLVQVRADLYGLVPTVPLTVNMDIVYSDLQKEDLFLANPVEDGNFTIKAKYLTNKKIGYNSNS